MQKQLLTGEGVEVLWTEDGWKVDLKKFGWKNTMEEAEAIAQKLQMCYTDGAEGGKDTTPEGKQNMVMWSSKYAEAVSHENRKWPDGRLVREPPRIKNQANQIIHAESQGAVFVVVCVDAAAAAVTVLMELIAI